ncbi:MAG: hypothetical protein ABIF71_15950 [Planctomycetota bacterium]
MKIFMYVALIVGVIATIATFGVQKYQAYEFWYRLVEEGELGKVMDRVYVVADEPLADARRRIVAMVNKAGYQAADENVVFHVKMPGMISAYSVQAYLITDPDVSQIEITVTVNYEVPVLFMSKSVSANCTKTIRR